MSLPAISRSVRQFTFRRSGHRLKWQLIRSHPLQMAREFNLQVHRAAISGAGKHASPLSVPCGQAVPPPDESPRSVIRRHRRGAGFDSDSVPCFWLSDRSQRTRDRLIAGSGVLIADRSSGRAAVHSHPAPEHPHPQLQTAPRSKFPHTEVHPFSLTL